MIDKIQIFLKTFWSLKADQKTFVASFVVFFIGIFCSYSLLVNEPMPDHMPVFIKIVSKAVFILAGGLIPSLTFYAFISVTSDCFGEIIKDYKYKSIHIREEYERKKAQKQRNLQKEIDILREEIERLK